jgi:hypothetical protein
MPKELKGSDYENALKDRLYALRDRANYHRGKFVNDLDKGKLNLKDIPIDESLFGDIPAPQNTPINKLNDTELPTIFGSSWSTNRDGTFSKVVDGVRWNIRENNDGSISVRNRTHGGATQKFNSWSDAEAAFPDLLEDGKKQNRESLKRFIAPYDPNGDIAKMIDNGDTAEDIHAALLANTDFMDALARREILPISYMSKIDRLGNNRQTPPTLNRTNIGPKKLVNPVIPPGYVQTPAGILPQKFANRADNGSEFDVPVDLEAIRDLTPGGRQEQLEQLFESFPDAKFAPDGSIVIYRKTKKEPHGPKRGQRFTTELRVQGDARQNQWKIIVKVTDPTGESKEYMHYSGHNSWESLIGRANESREGNGISDMLDKYFNRDADFFKRKGKRLGWDQKKIAKQERVWGGVAGGLKRLRTSNPTDKLKRILDENGKGQTDLALRTIEEHTAITLNGIAEELATDLRWWRKRFSGINSFWDALDKNDNDAAATLFNHFSLSLPDNDDARQRALAVMSDGIDRLYPGANAKAKKDLLQRAAAALKQGVVPADEVDPRAKPFVDKNGVTLKEGDHVQWESNVYGKSTGQIVRFLPLDTTKDGEFSFTDYVMVKFKGKKKPERLVASNMKRVDKDTSPITEYSFWLRNDDLKIARAKKAGYSYDPDRHAIVDSDGDIVERLGDDNSDNEDGDDDTGGGGGGGTPPVAPTNQPPAPAGQTTPPATQPSTPTTPAATTTAAEEFVDVDSLTPENITAGAFSNPTKKIKTTKAKRKDVGNFLPYGNAQPDLDDNLQRTRANSFWNQNNTEEDARAGLVDDPENTIVLADKKLAKLLKLDSRIDVVVVKPTEESKKAKNVLVEKGKALWEKAKTSKGYKKVVEARKKYEDRVASQDKILSDINKELDALSTERKITALSLYDNENNLPNTEEFSDFRKSLPKEISSSVGQFQISDELAEKLRSYGGNVSTYTDSSEPSNFFDINAAENNPALKRYLETDTNFSKEEIQSIMEAQNVENLGLYSLRSPTFPQLIHISSLPELERKNLVRMFYAKRTNSEKVGLKLKQMDEDIRALEERRLDVQTGKDYVSAYSEWMRERAVFMRDYLKESGVQMGSRSAEDFGDRLVIVEDRGSGWKQSKEELLKAFNEALSFMPDASVDLLLDHLKKTNNVLEFGGIKRNNRRNSRGNFESWGATSKKPDGSPSGPIQINVGSGGMGGLFPVVSGHFDSHHTDTALHELWHFVQYVNPNLGAIENTYMFDKLVSDEGKPVLAFGKVKGYEDSEKLEVGIQGMFQEEYMSKLYPRTGLNALLNPQDRSTELTTVLMQGLFTDPKYSGRGLGRRIYVKEGKYRTKYIDSRDQDALGRMTESDALPTAYYNPEDGKYYVDSAFSIPLESRGRSIYTSSGRAAGDISEEDELMSLGLGIMYAFDGAA